MDQSLKSRMMKGGTAIAIALSFSGYYEGRSLIAYLDPKGIPTICDGVTKGVHLGDKATPAECDARTLASMQEAKRIFNQWVPESVRTTMPQISLAMFYDFIYNTGPGKPGTKDGFVWLTNGSHSTMLRKLQAGDVEGACKEFTNWDRNSWRGLVKRRAANRDYCLGALHEQELSR